MTVVTANKRKRHSAVSMSMLLLGAVLSSLVLIAHFRSQILIIDMHPLAGPRRGHLTTPRLLPTMHHSFRSD